GGKIVMVGMPASGAVSSYEPVNFAAVGQSMIGSKMGDVVIRRDIPWMIDLYGQGRLKLDELISRRWRLDEINEAIADTRSGSAKRNVIMLK
ncbi:MAG TPA: zinc-binding dehydrogenase, partial [Roseovarius nubinhibens]|nr:zinc-binding dehydrogenase [Roseovarius nubinhibens]